MGLRLPDHYSRQPLPTPVFAQQPKQFVQTLYCTNRHHYTPRSEDIRPIPTYVVYSRMDSNHSPGRHHTNDALSRRVDGTRAATTDLHANPGEERVDWPTVQQQDPDLAFVYNLVKNQTSPPSPEEHAGHSADVKTLCAQFQRHVQRHVILPDGTLCRAFTHASSSNAVMQKVVPLALRRHIAQKMHCGLNGGHLGLRRARLELQQRFYWPNWGTYVQIAKRECAQCARY